MLKLNLSECSNAASLRKVNVASKLLETTEQDVIRKLVFRHRKKIYCKFGDDFFQFPATKELIIPFHEIERLSKGVVKLEDGPKFLNPYFAEKTPIAVILGHFNHGKTTLLDYLCGTSCVANEAHEITQIIRSQTYDLDINCSDESSKKMAVTFMDTPGQDLFYRMRNYGASVADFGILMIAADEGIVNQTAESIGIIESLGIPCIVCINKIDKCTPERCEEVEASVKEYVILDKAPIARISAKSGLGVDKLRLLIAEVVSKIRQPSPSTATPSPGRKKRTVRQTANQKSQSIIAAHNNNNNKASERVTGEGTVLDSSVSRQHGHCLHIALHYGQLRVGDAYACGGHSGVVKRMEIKSVCDDDTSRLGTKGATVLSAGEAALVTVTLAASCGEPKPLGSRLLAFGQVAGDSPGAAFSPALTPAQLKKACALAESVADQERMLHSFDDYKVSVADVRRLRLAKVCGIADSVADDDNNDIGNFELGQAHEEEVAGEVAVTETAPLGDKNHTDTGTGTGSHISERDVELPRVVIKTDSDLTMSTFQDALQDMKEHGDTSEAQRGAGTGIDTGTGTEGLRCEVVRWGVGSVTVTDVTVAKAANAQILLYNTSVDKDARALIQKHRIQVTQFDLMSGLLDVLVKK